VRVSARNLNGATYVIAVNTTEATLQAKISVEGIAGRSPVIVGGGQVVGADDTGFADNFGPLAARVLRHDVKVLVRGDRSRQLTARATGRHDRAGVVALEHPRRARLG